MSSTASVPVNNAIKSLGKNIELARKRRGLSQAEAKRKGYALAVEEWQLGEMGLASAILNRDKQPIGAIHISGSCSDWTPEDFSAKFAPLVISAARALHEQ